MRRMTYAAQRELEHLVHDVLPPGRCDVPLGHDGEHMVSPCHEVPLCRQIARALAEQGYRRGRRLW